MNDQLILIYSYLHGIWRYRWSALMVAWLIALPGWAVVYALPDLYTSKTIIHVDTKSIIKPLLKGLTVKSNVNSGLGLMKQLLLSRKNLEEVIRETDMDLGADDPEAMDRTVDELVRSIKLKKRKRAKIYELSYQGNSTEQVYKVVSKLLNILIENTLDSARTDTVAAQKFIEYQITEYEKRLTGAELKLAEFKRANLGLMPDKRGGYYKKLQHEQRVLEDVRSELRLAQRKYSEMKKQLKGELPLLGSNRYREQKALKLRKYREQLEVLLTQYTEQHPDVQAVKAAIAEVLAEDGGDEAKYMNGDPVELSPVYQALKSDIRKEGIEVETLKLKLQEKTTTVKNLKQSVDVIPGIEAKLAKLNRDYDITRERYLRLVERREEARLAQDVGQSGSNISFQIIEPPRIPTKPSGPNRLLFLTIVFLVAISAGMGWGFLRYFLRPTFIVPSQISGKTGFPVLGSVGLFVTAEHKMRRKMQLTSFLVVFSLLVVSYGGSMVYREPGSDIVKSLIS